MRRDSLDRRAFLSLSAGATVTLMAHRTSGAEKSLPTDDLTRLTLEEAAVRVRNRDVSSVELTKACLARIEQYDSKINTFITVSSQFALAQAQVAENDIRNGRWRGPLHGIPIALKDNIDTFGIRTTAASAVFAEHIPARDAEVARRLKEAGAVLLGKLNMWQFTLTPASPWGPVHNPWKLEYEAGYSSSGSAAAIAADFCFGALGTDHGGSVRIPASACGVVGLKPTYGLVSNRGVMNGEGSMDHVGCLCKTVLDTALVLQGIAGYDAESADSVRADLPDFAAALRASEKPLRVGIPKAGFFEHLDPEVAQLTDAAIETMRTIGALSSTSVKVPLYWEIMEGLAAESLAYHAPLLEKAAERYPPALRKSLASALQKCVSGVEYVNARRALLEARRHAASIFEDEFDLLVLPTWKRLPMTLEARQTRSLSQEDFMQELWNTLPFNVLGLPAISVPCGYTRDGLPVGVQIVGRPFAEPQVLAFAHAYEQATRWHSRNAIL